MVDDDPDYLELSKFFLKMQNPNHVVMTFSTSQKAIEYIVQHRLEVSAIVSDYNMDFCFGLCFFKQIRKLGLSVPFILCSSFVTQPLIDYALDLGISYVIQKGDAEYFDKLRTLLTQYIEA